MHCNNKRIAIDCFKIMTYFNKMLNRSVFRNIFNSLLFVFLSLLIGVKTGQEILTFLIKTDKNHQKFQEY